MTEPTSDTGLQGDERLYVYGRDVYAPVATQWVHHDETVYPNAHAFEPLRSAELHAEAEEGVKHQFATTTPECLPFGHGRHAR